MFFNWFERGKDQLDIICAPTGDRTPQPFRVQNSTPTNRAIWPGLSYFDSQIVPDLTSGFVYFWHVPVVLWELPSFWNKMFQTSLVFSLPSPGITYFSKGPWFLLLENEALFVGWAREYIYIFPAYTHIGIYIYLHWNLYLVYSNTLTLQGSFRFFPFLYL